MTDLLTSLVDRALARAPVLQRRQPTLFEPIAEVSFNPRSQTASADTIHEENDFVERDPIIRQDAESRPRPSFHHPSPAEETRVADYQPRNLRPRKRKDAPPAEAERESDHREYSHAPPRSESTGDPIVRDEASTRSAVPDRDLNPETKSFAPARMIETIIEKRVEREIVSEPFKATPVSEESTEVVPSQTNRRELSNDRENQRPTQPLTTELKRVNREEEASRIKPRRQKPEPNHDNHPVIRAAPRITPERTRRQPPQPTIHVTIGRVEVRATTPAAGRVQSARPAGPKLSLEEYLRSRGEGSQGN